MNYIFGLLVAFLLFPVVISGLAQLSKYLDEKTMARTNDDHSSGAAKQVI